MMTDGDAHQDAVAELCAINARGGDFSRAVGALIRKRHEALRAGRLDSAFSHHDLPSGERLYAISLCVGRCGVTAVFALKGRALVLLSVAAFDDFIAEALTAGALNAAIAGSVQRI